jgi:hypothetical protein
MIGAFVRWASIGFKRPYQDVLNGPESDDPYDGMAYHLVTKVIGVITLAVILYLLFNVPFLQRLLA